VCCVEVVFVQQGERVGAQIPSRVTRMPGLVGRRSAGVALVVADHEAPASGEQPAEAVRPPEHRTAEAHHEQHRWILGVAE
jgi:hypothetical protein